MSTSVLGPCVARTHGDFLPRRFAAAGGFALGGLPTFGSLKPFKSSSGIIHTGPRGVSSRTALGNLP
jgi:hypothetical protein